MDAAEKIKKIRKEKGITQKELAKRLGWSAAHVSQYETGTRTPKHETLVKIASALGCDIRDLMPDIIITVLQDGEVYQGFDDSSLPENAKKLIYFAASLKLTGIIFDPADMSVTFDNEKYFITSDQAFLIMDSTENHIKTLIRLICKKVEE